jgi:hypothetical protein
LYSWSTDRRTAYGVALVAFFARFLRIHSQVWYPDEGAFTELALSLWRGGPASIGALKQTALSFPLACSNLAPLLAAPWAGLAHEAIVGVRTGSALLGAGACFALLRLGQVYGRPWIGLGAGLALALWALPVHLGVWAVYHHLGALGVVLSAAAAARFQAAPSRGRWLWLCLSVGITLAAAFWTLWMLCLPLALACRKERRAWIFPGALCLGLPLVLGLAIAYWGRPSSLAADGRALIVIATPSLPAWLGSFFSFYRVIQSFPAFALGLFGLAWLFEQDRRDRRLSPLGAAALTLLLGCVEVFRQRQNLEGFPYPLVLALPAFCLGLGVVLEHVIQARAQGQRRWILLALLGAGVFVPRPRFALMESLGAPPEAARGLLAKAAKELKAGDLVLGQSALNWGLPRGVKACQWEDLALAQGKRIDLYSMSMPQERFLFVPRLEEARWLIVSPYTYGYTFSQPSMRELGLQAEQLGFRQTWANAGYAIFEKQALPGTVPAGHLLAYFNLYDLAAQEALARDDLPSARFALRQGLPYRGGDPGARRRLLKQVEQKMGLK